MANRAFLMLNLSGDPNEEFASEAIAVAASYCYPVLWWSLFSQADIVLRTEEWKDDEGNPVPVSFDWRRKKCDSSRVLARRV